MSELLVFHTDPSCGSSSIETLSMSMGLQEHSGAHNDFAALQR